MVVDDNGVVQWRTIAPGSIGTNSCEWELNPGHFKWLRHTGLQPLQQRVLIVAGGWV